MPREIRDGSLALGPPCGRRPGGRPCPSAVPGIATGTILGLSRASARRRRCCSSASPVGIRFDPDGLLSGFTALPIQIFNWTVAAAGGVPASCRGRDHRAAGDDPGLNALAIFIRNKFQRRW